MPVVAGRLAGINKAFHLIDSFRKELLLLAPAAISARSSRIYHTDLKKHWSNC